MKHLQPFFAALCLVLFAGAGIGLSAQPPSPQPSKPQPPTPPSSSAAVPQKKKPVMKKCKLGNVRPIHAWKDIYLAGQPTPEDLPLLQQAGVKTVISLRHTKEIPWDEAAALKKLGIQFVHAPFQDPRELTPEVFDKVRKVLCDKKRGVTFFHCGSSNRVGAVWYAHRVLDGGISPEEALREAKMAGLRTPEYLKAAVEYVEKTQKVAAAEKLQHPSAPPKTKQP